jgi:hypothetical protein
MTQRFLWADASAGISAINRPQHETCNEPPRQEHAAGWCAPQLSGSAIFFRGDIGSS